MVPNPHNPKRFYRVSLLPKDVRVIVFWTRHPRPLMPYLKELDERGYKYYFQYTLMNNPPELDPAMPELEKRIDTFRELADTIGSEKDVEAISRFLKQQFLYRAENRVYFTNDQVIEYLDRNGFDWPVFPLREPYKDETEEHTAILGCGHEYQNKTAYIGRVLAAMHSFRPQGRALLERVHEVGIVLVKPEVRDAQAVIRSNAYFGKKLREAGVSAEELEMLVMRAANREEGVIPLAERLGCSLYETVALLRDIRDAEKDERRLIDFSNIVAPRWGVAADKKTLSEWRLYAGAHRRATREEALKRASERSSEAKSLREEICRWLRQPKSDYAKAIMQQAVSIGDAFYRLVGGVMKEYRSRKEYLGSSRPLDVERNLSIPNAKVRVTNSLPSEAEVVYFREFIEQKLKEKPNLKKEYENAKRISYERAQNVLSSNGVCSDFEAKFYTDLESKS